MNTARVFRPEDMAVATITLRFDPRAVDCMHCPLLETYSRKQCRYTGEYIANEKATGILCPLHFEESELNKILYAKEI